MTTSGDMDVPWVLNELKLFSNGARPNGGLGPRVGWNEAEAVLLGRLAVVEPILDKLVPGWKTSMPTDKWNKFAQPREAALRSITTLERGEELKEKLGDSAPRLSASAMHHWVWSAAQSLWQSGHYRNAVGNAALKVNAETQNKAGTRKLSEIALFNVVFSFDRNPKTDQPKFILDADDGTPTADSERRGIRSLAEACYALIRNPLNHNLGDISETEALEQLAMFSVLSKWIEGSAVVTAP